MKKSPAFTMIDCSALCILERFSYYFPGKRSIGCFNASDSFTYKKITKSFTNILFANNSLFRFYLRI